MNTQDISSATVKLNVPQGILRNAQVEAHRIGISLQEFIRMLMATYFANSNSIRTVSRNQALFDHGQREIQRGSYTKIKTKTELKSYLAVLDN